MLDKGDAWWSTRKVILGCLIDTLEGTIELPPHRRDRLKCPTADGSHTQADHYEGMVEDSRGTSEHDAWNTQWAGVALSTPACSP